MLICVNISLTGSQVRIRIGDMENTERKCAYRDVGRPITAKFKPNGTWQATIPIEFLRATKTKEGAVFQAQVGDDGSLKLVPIKGAPA